MSVEAIDRALAEWEERLRRIDESLLALEAEPTYQILAASLHARAPLEGETRRVVEPALDALRDVFEQRGKLTEVLDRAKELREGMSGLAFWANEEKARQIEALLFGASVELERQATPLAGRSLLDPGRRDARMAPEQLLAAMAGAFERARDAVVAVRRAWDGAEPALAEVAQGISEARGSAASLGVEPGVLDELAAIEHELEATRVRLAKDPLGASADAGAHLQPRLAAVTSGLAELAAQRARVDDGVARARGLMIEARMANARATDAIERMPREVEGAAAPGTPTDAGLVEGLAPWLEKIEAAAAAGRWHAAEVGVTKWTEAAREYLANDGKIAGALDTVLALREELAGRLSARRAQAAALAARGVEVNPGAEDVAKEAQRLLGARPTPLARARALVERYDSMVRR